MTLLVSMGASAQGNGIGGITEATNMVTSYFDPGTKLIYAIGAVIGILTFVVLSIVALVTYRNTKSYKDEEGFM